jgi:hypothetical protein
MFHKLKLFFLFLISILAILAFICLYRAFVVIQPCKHKIEYLNANNKLNLEEIQIERLKNALRLKTITFDESNQNLTAIAEYSRFIRTGRTFYFIAIVTV